MLQAISALSDNYIWVWQLDDRSWVVVDPGESEPVLNFCGNISHILITHHHQDHTGGIMGLKLAYPNAKVIGPAGSYHDLDQVVSEGDEILGMQVIATPGHTLDHVIYVDNKKAIVGDHLFKYGCGRIFEGSFEIMYDSINKLKRLPENLICYPAHEYTLNNLYFTLKFRPFPGIEEVISETKRQAITLPMLLSEQLKHNPFLACNNFADFCYLRQTKDVFNC